MFDLSIGAINPLYVDWSNFADRETQLRLMRAQLRATLVEQYMRPGTDLAQVKAYLDTALLVGVKVCLGYDWTPSGNPDIAVWGPLLSDPAITAHPALAAYFMQDEPQQHGFPPPAVQYNYTAVKAMAPAVPVVVGYSGEIWRFNNFSAGQCDIAQLSALEWRRAPDGTLHYQRDDLINNHTASRARIKAVAPETKVWSTIQAFSGGTYYQPPAVEFTDALALLLGPELSKDMSLSAVLAQRWSGRAPSLSEKSLPGVEFVEHRLAMANLIVGEPEPEPEPAPVLEYWPGGAVVTEDGEYFQISPRALKAGGIFPRGYWSKYGHIQVRSKP